MRHVDPDTLALLALGEKVADDVDRVHLIECAECSRELNFLSRAARVGRSTLDAELLTPSSRVWDRIADDLDLAVAPATVTAPAGGPALAAVTELAPRRRRWSALMMAAAVAAVIALGGVASWQLLRPVPAVVLASATLESFPDWAGSTGSAVVEEGPDGSRSVRVDISVPEERDGFTEVWLISSDATKLISLGTVHGSTGVLPIPAGVDLSVYDLVDLSSEPIDGDPTHSGDSILRGQLS